MKTSFSTDEFNQKENSENQPPITINTNTNKPSKETRSSIKVTKITETETILQQGKTQDIVSATADMLSKNNPTTSMDADMQQTENDQSNILF